MKNKFEFLEDVVSKNLGIILLPKAKFDVSFPSAQFILKGYGVHTGLTRTPKVENLYFLFVKIYPQNPQHRPNCNIDHIMQVKYWEQIILSALVSSLINTAKCIEISYFDFNATTNENCMEEFYNLNWLTSFNWKTNMFQKSW